mgnify:CR=1 FL=1
MQDIKPNGQDKQQEGKVVIKVKDKQGHTFDFGFSPQEALRISDHLRQAVSAGPPQPTHRIPYPPVEVFKNRMPSVIQHLTRTPQVLPIISKIEYPPEGGMYVYYKDIPYPRKGFPFPEGVQAANIAKRLMIGQIRYLKKNWFAAVSLLRRKNLQEWLRELNSAANIALDPYLLKPERYQPVNRELRKFINVFLTEIGIELSDDYAETLTTLFEYDDAYVLILKDLASETSVEKLLKDPVGEFERLYLILKSRDKRTSMREKARSFVFLFRLLFLLPRVRKAFRKALTSIDFSQVQMDQGDRYNALRWSTYDFFGESLETRIDRLKAIHKDNLPKAIIIQSKA